MEEPVKVNMMNLSQIKAGDYSSLLGEWEEVAVSLNRHDGNGSIWLESKASLKIDAR